MGEQQRWYLGIDLGSVGISAALLDRETNQQYPIFWQGTAPDGTPITVLRSPAIVYLSAEQLNGTPETPMAVGELALKVRSAMADHPSPGLLLSNLRQLLTVALPYLSPQRQTWEPRVQWSDTQCVSLAWVKNSVIALLSTLKPDPLTISAQGLSSDELQTALSKLEGVILGCPTGWSEAYRFNLREAILSAGLVTKPEQIFFIEEAIATLLSELPGGDELTSISEPVAPRYRGQKPESSLQGSTLILSAGALFTEFLLVDLPPDPRTLNREDLYLRSAAYGGNAIDQDIICQLLYPSVWGWRNLGSPHLDLPLPGEPDLAVRYRFQQRLRSNDLGQNLLRIAKQLKLAFQREESATFTLHERQWTMTQQDFHSRVMAPYIQLINREINTLLTQTGIVVQTVRQVLCTGGTASNAAIAHWLKQKFPNATLVQDTFNSMASSSRTASGLAKLPLYPQLLDSARHQYSSYFLLRELLQTLPNEPLPLGRILQLLEAQGINTQACLPAIINLLEGQLPAGLVPSKADLALLTPESRQNPEYQALAGSPLFLRESNQVYRLNPDLRNYLWQYLSKILDGTHQTLEESLLLDLGVQVAI